MWVDKAMLEHPFSSQREWQRDKETHMIVIPCDRQKTYPRGSTRQDPSDTEEMV